MKQKFNCWKIVNGTTYNGTVRASSKAEANKEFARRISAGELNGLDVCDHSVWSLSREQIRELKDNFFWGEETQDLIPEDVWYAEDLPDKLIYDYYSGISFSDDDFHSVQYQEPDPVYLPFV